MDYHNVTHRPIDSYKDRYKHSEPTQIYRKMESNWHRTGTDISLVENNQYRTGTEFYFMENSQYWIRTRFETTSPNAALKTTSRLAPAEDLIGTF